MKFYVLTRDGVPFSITFESPFPVTDTTISAHTFDEAFPDLNVMSWNPTTDRYELTGLQLTKLNFLSRFTLQERIAIRQSTDPVVEDIMDLLNAATYINVADQTTRDSVNYLASVGLISATRAQEILS
jgi:hypothetical protein